MRLANGVAITTEQPILNRCIPLTGNHSPMRMKLVALLLK
jgi:hypothetical protein